MSTTNNGGQVLTFDYKQEGTSQGFNRLFYKVLPVGIISGGDLARVTDASVELTPMVAMFEDTQNKVAVRIETTTNASIGVSISAPYVIAKFKWINVEENYVEFAASEFGEIDDGSIIIGKCIYKKNVLSGFDYTRKTWSQDHYWNKDHLDFRVTPAEPEDKTIKIGKGNAIIGGKVVDFAGGIKTINTNVTLQRIDLISINADGKVIITEGVESEPPKIPVFPANMLTVASIKMGSNPQTIKGDMITNYYNSNFIQSSSALQFAEIIEKDTSIEYVQEDTKYILENTTKSLTLDKATQKGCVVQVYANIKDAKLILKHPNTIYKLTKGEYIHLIWNGIDWIDTDRITSWDLRNTPYSVPLGADLNDYTKAGTWKNNKLQGIKNVPEEIIQAEESGNDHKSYSTIVVEEGEGWIKQFITYVNSTVGVGNGSGHYTVTRGALISPEGEVQWQPTWTCKVHEANTVQMTWFINTAYPKGSYYWTSEESFDPNDVWKVGTWERVKDKMLMAKGSTFTTNGGNATGLITLSVAQLPSHNHTISHTHTYSTTTGSNGAHTHSISGNTADESGHTHGMSHQHSFKGSQSHSHRLWSNAGDMYNYTVGLGNISQNYNGLAALRYGSIEQSGHGYYSTVGGRGTKYVEDTTVTISGTTTGGKNTTDKGSAHHHSISLTSGSNGAHTHTVSGTTAQASNTSSGNTGSGSSINIMPPYEVAYCWKRTK